MKSCNSKTKHDKLYTHCKNFLGAKEEKSEEMKEKLNEANQRFQHKDNCILSQNFLEILFQGIAIKRRTANGAICSFGAEKHAYRFHFNDVGRSRKFPGNEKYLLAQQLR